MASLLSPSMSGAAVSATIDRSAVSLNETIQLVLESDDKSGTSPDLSVLAPDFEILGRRTSHQVSVINGRSSERHLLILRIRPRRVGEMRIPPIPFGEVATESLKLSVSAPPAGTPGVSETDSDSPGGGGPASGPTVLLEANLEPRQGHVGEQLILTAKVLMEGSISGPRLRDPQISNARILALGEDHYQAERDGKSYRVYERRYALFPQSPGRLKIDPLVFEGWASGITLIPGAGYPSPGQEVRALSTSLSAEVLPAPDGEGKGTWLPARNLTLTELGPATYRAGTGQPIVRRINLRAEGIMSQDLPALGLQVPYQLAEQREEPQLWDERRPDGVIGNRQEVFVLRAQEPGQYRLPPVSLDWWDTATGRWETAAIPARDLVVSEASEVAAGQPSSVGSPPQRQSARSDEAAPSVEASAKPPQAMGDESAGTSNPWIWIALTLALAWTATIAAWWRGRRRGAAAIAPAPSAASAPPQVEETDPLQCQIDAVRAAYQTGDAGAAREALLAWAERILPDRTPSNLARLAERCPQPLRDQILLLERAFFSPMSVPWDKQPVWEGLVGFVPAPPEEPATFRRGKPIRRRAANPDAE